LFTQILSVRRASCLFSFVKFSLLILVLAPLAGGFLTGCQSTPDRPPLQTNASDFTRNNAYSLLHQLFGDEKDISKLRFIKAENKDLKNLLNRVAAAARAGEKQLDEFARVDPGLRLKDYLLPPGEVKTRDAISKDKEHELLHQSHDRLEFTLLLTQVEALNYASHLAKVAAENDSNSERSHYLMTLSNEMTGLHEEVVTRLSLNFSAMIH
jgi:hypothetical protein